MSENGQSDPRSITPLVAVDGVQPELQHTEKESDTASKFRFIFILFYYFQFSLIDFIRASSRPQSLIELFRFFIIIFSSLLCRFIFNH